MRPALLVVLAALLAAGEADPRAGLLPKTEAWKRTAQHLRFNNGAEPQTLDVQVMTGIPEATLATALFAGLVDLHPRTLAPMPGLAESWTRSDDGLDYAFRLRDGLAWSDGEPLTAAVIAASWRRALTRATGCQYANMLFPIAGAEGFFTAATQDDAAWAGVGVAAPDARTVTVRLHAPCAYFLQLAAFHTLMPVPLHAIARHGEAWTRPGNLVASGPFVLATWEPRVRIDLTPNPRYHDRAVVKLERITAHPYDDLDTAYKLFQQGGLDWMSAVPSERIDALKLDPAYYVSPYLAIYYLRLNTTRGALADARVRRALALAIDRREITEHLLRAGQIPAASFCPAGAGGYPEGPEARPDVPAARALLAEAGFPEGKNLPAIELLFNTSEQHKKICENVAEQWRRNLGITAAPRNCEWKVYLDRLQKLDYDAARSGWTADYDDPMTFFDIWMTGDGNNRTGFADPAYDDLVRAAAREVDAARRLGIFQKADRLLQEASPGIPLYVYVNQGLLNERVRGWWPNRRDHHPFQWMWLEDRK